MDNYVIIAYFIVKTPVSCMLRFISQRKNKTNKPNILLEQACSNTIVAHTNSETDAEPPQNTNPVKA